MLYLFSFLVVIFYLIFHTSLAKVTWWSCLSLLNWAKQLMGILWPIDGRFYHRFQIERYIHHPLSSWCLFSHFPSYLFHFCFVVIPINLNLYLVVIHSKRARVLMRVICPLFQKETRKSADPSTKLYPISTQLFFISIFCA